MAFSSEGANRFLDKRDAAREKRRDKEELRREKELDREFQREGNLFGLVLQNLKDSNKYLKGDKYTSAVKANQTLRNNLIDADLTVEDLEFYKPILEDPFASQFVQDFMKERAGQGLKITYSMLPSMLNVMSSNAPETEKIDFIERITGTDFTGEAGIKRYRELATEIVSAPTEIQSTLFVSPKPGMSINTKNRDASIKADYIKYGPLNVDEPGDYWKKLAEYWETTEEAAKKSLCGNCVAFDISPRMKECMPGEVSDDSGVLGYCWMHNFKCHSARTCRTWAKGGPIEKDSVSYDWQERKEK